MYPELIAKPAPKPAFSPEPFAKPASSFRLPGEALPVRRRPSREQGYALERLGHAVEYLIDSRRFQTEVPYGRSEEQAVKILMALNRMVFDSCPEVLPIRRRVAGSISRIFSGHGGDRAATRVP